MCAKYQKYAIALIASIFILSIISSITLQPVKAGIPNGNIITSVTGTYGVGGNICFDGAYYYVLYQTGTYSLNYAYATNPLGTWSIKTISTNSVSGYTWYISCGVNSIPTLIVYSLANCNVNSGCSTTYVNITSIHGGNIGNTNAAFKVTGYYYNSIGITGIVDNFYSYPAPKNEVWISIITSGEGSSGGCGGSFLYVVGVYPPTSGTWGAEPGIRLASNACYNLSSSIYDNNGLPAIVYESGHIGSANWLNETQMNKVINQTTYYFTSPVSNGITNYYYTNNFASTYYNGNIMTLNGCYQTIYSASPCYSNFIIDYWSFNLLDQNWTKISSNIAGSLLHSTNGFYLNTDINTGIVRAYYYTSSNIDYFYPANETGSTIHIGYTSAGNTIDGMTVNQYSQAQNYYYAYTVSSTTPHQLYWASYTTQPSTVTTVTGVIYSTVIVSPALSKCTNTNSCVTNQFSSFLTILLPSIIITALMLYFPYKMGIKDERVYIFIFMMIISGIGFLSAGGAFGNNGIPWYIPIFVDIIGFMLIISFRNNNSGDSM